MPLKQTKKTGPKPQTETIAQQSYGQPLAYSSVAYGSPMKADATTFGAPNYYATVAAPATTSTPTAPTREVPDSNRRNWEAWSQQENQAFFESLVRNSSRSWATIAADVGTKRQEQVRTYYYRVLRKVSRLLQQVNYSFDNRDRIATLLAMMAYWETKNETRFEETTVEFAEAIKERIGRQRSALESIRAKRMTAPPEKLVVQLVPKNEDVSKTIELGGYNPRLQLTLRSSKSIAGVVNHISKKWVGPDGKCLAPYPIRLYPIEKRPGHIGWGAEDAETLLLGIFQSLGCPQAVRFEYGWPEVVVPMGIADNSGFDNDEDTLSDLAILQQQQQQQLRLQAMPAQEPAPQPLPNVNYMTAAPPHTLVPQHHLLSMSTIQLASQPQMYDPTTYVTTYAQPLLYSSSLIMPSPSSPTMSASSQSSDGWDESYAYEPSSVEEMPAQDANDYYTYVAQQVQPPVANPSYFDAAFY